MPPPNPPVSSASLCCSLLAIAKQQGAVGTATRGACKICGQTGHLTKQCRNALPGGGEGGGAEAAALLEAPPADDGADSLDLSSDSSDEERRRCVVRLACVFCGRRESTCELVSQLFSTCVQLPCSALVHPLLCALTPSHCCGWCRKRRKKEKKRKEKERKRRKEKKRSKDKKRKSSSKDKKRKRRRSSSSDSGSSSSSGSDSD